MFRELRVQGLIAARIFPGSRLGAGFCLRVLPAGSTLPAVPWTLLSLFALWGCRPVFGLLFRQRFGRLAPLGGSFRDRSLSPFRFLSLFYQLFL